MLLFCIYELFIGFLILKNVEFCKQITLLLWSLETPDNASKKTKETYRRRTDNSDRDPSCGYFHSQTLKESRDRKLGTAIRRAVR